MITANYDKGETLGVVAGKSPLVTVFMNNFLILKAISFLFN